MLRHGSQKEIQKYSATNADKHNTLYCWRTLRKILLLLFFSPKVSVKNTCFRTLPNWEACAPILHLVIMNRFLFRWDCGIWPLARKLLSAFTRNLGQWDLLNKIAKLYILSQGTIQNKDAMKMLRPIYNHGQDLSNISLATTMVMAFVVTWSRDTLLKHPLPWCPLL